MLKEVLDIIKNWISGQKPVPIPIPVDNSPSRSRLGEGRNYPSYIAPGIYKCGL
jgi:hypothetical protein